MRIFTLKVSVLFLMILFGKSEFGFSQINIAPKSQKVCYQDSAILKVLNAFGTSSSFRWQDSSASGWQNIVDNSNIVGANNDTLFLRNLTTILNQKRYRCIVDSATTGTRFDTTKSASIFVRAELVRPKISSSQNICFGNIADTLIVSQYPSGGDTSFSYQWQQSSNSIVWTNLTNATNDSLALDTFTTNRYFRVVAISNSSCGSVLSDTVFVRYYKKLFRPYLNKKTFTACYLSNPDSLFTTISIANGKLNYHYQWQISTDSYVWNNILNDTLFQKNSSQSITDTLYYRLRATDKNACAVLFSDTSMAVPSSPLIVPSITGTQTICYNAIPDTLKIFPHSSLGPDVTYQWESSVNGTTFLPIVGQTNTFLVLSKNGTTKFYRVKISWASCTILYTNNVLVSVYADFIPGAIHSNQTICYNSSPGVLSFQTLPSGGGDTYTYKWQSSPDSIVYSDVPGATNFIFAAPALTTTTFYRIAITSAANCGTVFSNTIKIKVFPEFVGATIKGNDTICYNTSPDSIRLLSPPSGGNSSFIFRWQSSTNGFTWSNISGQTNSAYKPSELKVTTMYRLINSSAIGCGTDTSNIITIKVWPNISKARISSHQNICYNSIADTLRVTQLAQGVNGVFTYQWQSSNNGQVWSNINGQSALKYFPGNLTTTTYFRIVANSLYGCGSIASDSVKVFVYGELTPALISENQSVCYDSIPKKFRISIKPTGANNLYTYQWQISNDSLNFLDLLGATDTVLQMNKHIINKYYRLRVTSTLGCGSKLSNIIRVKVFKKFEGAEIGNSVRICYGYIPVPLRMTKKPSGGSLSYTYQWQSSIDSIQWEDLIGEVADTLPMAQITRTTFYRLINSSTFSCGVDTSNVVSIYSLSLPDTTEINGLKEVCKNQQQLYYSLENSSNKYTYQWEISKGTILTNSTKTKVFITWDNASGLDTIYVKQTNKENGCFNIMKLPIEFKETQAPFITEIIRKSTTNILVSKDSSAGLHFQWGYILKSNLEAFDIPGAIYRYVQLPHAFDTLIYIYYLKSWFNDCITTTYYNFNPLALGITKNTKPSIHIYPNPSNGIYNVSGIDLSKVEVRAFDVLGKEKNIFIDSVNQQIIVNDQFLPGIYFLVFYTTNGLITERIILNR